MHKPYIEEFMKAILLILLFALVSTAAYTQPQKGDYIMISVPGQDFGHYVYKDSKKVFYEYYFNEKKSDNIFKKTAEQMKELFELAHALDWNGVKKYDELEALNAIKEAEESESTPYYCIFEYRKGTQTYRVCVLLNDDQDSKSVAFRKLAEALEGLW